MTLLTIAAVIALLFFMASAVKATSRVTALDTHPPGRWGIVSWRSTRTRPLDAHERRWQTALTAGKDTDARWRDFVVALERLEYTVGATPDSDAPDTFDHQWIETRLGQLESRIGDYPSGDSTQ